MKAPRLPKCPSRILLRDSASTTVLRSHSSASIPQNDVSELPEIRPRTSIATPPSSVVAKSVISNVESFPGGSLGSTLGFGGPKLTAEIYNKQFPGALPLEGPVYCWYAAQRVWFSATVISARPSVGGKNPLDGFFESAASSAVSGDTRSVVFGVAPRTADDAIVVQPFQWEAREAEYDYYIHFHGEDRRQDMWAVASLLRPDNFEFHAEEPFTSLPPGPDEVHKHMDAEYLREHEENTKLKTIGKIRLGQYLVETWYFSPYPREFQNLDVLYLCEFCLEFFKHECELQQHSYMCTSKHPPGDEIYRDAESKLSMFEIDGSLAKKYTENLSFLSKLFLDHKTLRHPVFLFLFYVLTEWHKDGYRIVGYFSKEKYSKNNLSCIMCLPQHQRKGYGQLLINMSYALSRKEGKRGTPERPLSDLGKATYIKYWSQAALAALLAMMNPEAITLETLAQKTSIEVADIAMALEAVGVLRPCQIRQAGSGVQTTSTRSVPYLFLPDEFLQAAKEWSRSAFVTQFASAPQLKEELIVTNDSKDSKGHRKKRRRGAPPEGEVSETVPFNRIAPINLADLKWESYDLHFGPFELALFTS